MHFNLRRRAIALLPFENFALVVDANDLLRRDEAFADAGGRGEIGAVPKLYGDVAVVGGHPAELPHLVADVAKFDP